tara:strand:- start:316 stop:897 length:582 start_codon:yes stop_codon:yes gene_type:complete
MGTNLHDVHYCQMDRTTELSNRMSSRNIPSHQIGQSYFGRPVDTYATLFPMLDCHLPSSVEHGKFPVYNQHKMFNPGQSAPFNGFAKNVDIETTLRNTIHPLQKAPQSKYIPDTQSDLFHNQYLTHTEKKQQIKNNLLFQKQNFSPFNPNRCNLGYKLFNNHTRIQTKDLPFLEEETRKKEPINNTNNNTNNE